MVNCSIVLKISKTNPQSSVNPDINTASGVSTSQVWTKNLIKIPLSLLPIVKNSRVTLQKIKFHRPIYIANKSDGYAA